jgi:hypothetical protein
MLKSGCQVSPPALSRTMTEFILPISLSLPGLSCTLCARYTAPSSLGGKSFHVIGGVSLPSEQRNNERHTMALQEQVAENLL